jgi:hypothetical protein
MNTLRNLLWKNLGITLDKNFFNPVGIVLGGCIAAIVFGFLWMNTHDAIFRILFYISCAPVVIILFGSLYRPLMWGFSNKEQRRELEQEVALEQFRRRAHDKHFER